MAKRTKKLIDNITTEDSIRLNKYLSDAGICSRRQADEYIAKGEVTVDGIVAETGTKVAPGQKVVFHGKEVNPDEKLILIAFNKPRGIVCTTDRREKDNIIDYINYGKRIYPIGRLDKDSEGIILLTNDGNIVNKILRAGNKHEKEYIVEINKPITAEFLKGMEEGVPILDTVTLPCQIKALSKTTFQIILTQGLNRQIRRMCEYFGYKVLTLKRIRIMNINLGHLQIGGYRNVTDKELAGLSELISESLNAPKTVSESIVEEISQKANNSVSISTHRKHSNVRTTSTDRTKSNTRKSNYSRKTSNDRTGSNSRTENNTRTRSNSRPENNTRVGSKSIIGSNNSAGYSKGTNATETSGGKRTFSNSKTLNKTKSTYSTSSDRNSFKKPDNSGRKYGRQANSNQRAGKKTK